MAKNAGKMVKGGRRGPIEAASNRMRKAAGRAVSGVTEPLTGQSVGPNAPMVLPKGLAKGPSLKPKGRTPGGAPSEAESARFTKMREHGSNRVFRRK